jgi:hypothetical protein
VSIEAGSWSNATTGIYFTLAMKHNNVNGSLLEKYTLQGDTISHKMKI